MVIDTKPVGGAKKNNTPGLNSLCETIDLVMTQEKIMIAKK